MITLQIIGLIIVAVYLVHRIYREDTPCLFIFRFITLSAASWVSEEAAIQIFQFYHYNPAWRLFLGHVPVLVIVAWPAVIYSEWELATQLLVEKKSLIPSAAAIIVWFDASLIEVIAVKAGLWSWRIPGIFGVPLIGIFGWAYFTYLSVLLLEKKKEKKGLITDMLAIFIFPVIGTQGLLLGTWWIFFRWIHSPIHPMVAAGTAWIVSLFLVLVVLQDRLGISIERRILTIRILPSLFFTILLFKVAADAKMLMAYVFAFIPPYLILYLKNTAKTKTKHNRKT
jgi:hypothetical protein